MCSPDAKASARVQCRGGSTGGDKQCKNLLEFDSQLHRDFNTISKKTKSDLLNLSHFKFLQKL